MPTLNPTERRAKADEIARLLENDPLLVDDLKSLISDKMAEDLAGHSIDQLEDAIENLEATLENSESLLNTLSLQVAKAKLFLEQIEDDDSPTYELVNSALESFE